jgi:trans-aconitate 2-methyltransferase
MAEQKWDPAQYEKFREQRRQPFNDLIAWVKPRRDMRAIDLGCGTGELTCALAERFGGGRILGIDTSESMLKKAAERANPWVEFRQQDINEINNFGDYDLIFSHAAFHWVPDNEALMRRILGQMKPGAQIAVQLPTNGAHPSHTLAAELAQEEPFSARLGGFVAKSEALPLERYATLLWQHGLREQVCIEKIFGHELPHSSDVVEWVKGTLLTAYLSRLDDRGQQAFLAAYRKRLVDELGDQEPYFYPFRRLLFWGIKS